jgi:hypothetical protein
MYWMHRSFGFWSSTFYLEDYNSQGMNTKLLFLLCALFIECKVVYICVCVCVISQLIHYLQWVWLGVQNGHQEWPEYFPVDLRWCVARGGDLYCPVGWQRPYRSGRGHPACVQVRRWASLTRWSTTDCVWERLDRQVGPSLCSLVLFLIASSLCILLMIGSRVYCCCSVFFRILILLISRCRCSGNRYVLVWFEHAYASLADPCYIFIF